MDCNISTKVYLFPEEADKFLLVSLKIRILQPKLIKGISKNDSARASLVNKHPFNLGIHHYG